MHVMSFRRMRARNAGLRRAALLACLALAACGDSPTETPPEKPGDTFLEFESSPGDWVGQGQTRRYTPKNGSFSVMAFTLGPNSTVNRLQFSFEGSGSWWRLNLAAPGASALKPGVYENAARWPFQESTQPGLDFSGDSRGCNILTGSFTIHELEIGALNRVERLRATFVQNCEATMPPLRGEVAFDAAAAR
jgi:hypothetical protein